MTLLKLLRNRLAFPKVKYGNWKTVIHKIPAKQIVERYLKEIYGLDTYVFRGFRHLSPTEKSILFNCFYKQKTIVISASSRKRLLNNI